MCDFCAIANKQLPAHVVYENERIIAFLDYEPIHEGHTLICPKEHVDSINQISEEALLDIMHLSKSLIKAFQELYGNEGYTIMQNGGRFCDYGHAHFHVFARFENDGFGWKEPDMKSEYSERVAEKIRAKLI